MRHYKATAAAVLALAGATALAGCSIWPRERPSREALVIDHPPCGTVTFPIYFETGRDRLTPQALQLVSQAAEEVGRCAIRSVTVIGLADAGGPDEVNLDLSRRRAERVAHAFAARGWPAPVFEHAALGATGAVSPDGRREPVRRRVEVRVRAENR